MPSLATRLAIHRVALSQVDEATAAAQAAADAANTAATTANDTIAFIEAGTLDLDAVTVSGTRFINDGGTLVAEP